MTCNVLKSTFGSPANNRDGAIIKCIQKQRDFATKSITPHKIAAKYSATAFDFRCSVCFVPVFIMNIQGNQRTAGMHFSAVDAFAAANDQFAIAVHSSAAADDQSAIAVHLSAAAVRLSATAVHSSAAAVRLSAAAVHSSATAVHSFANADVQYVILSNLHV